MGADGGTIPKRCELVPKKKKKEKVDKNVKNASRWRLCRLTQQPLRKPIVACRLGGLYNKEAVIDALLTKKIGENENAKHIRGLKDIKELKLYESREFKDSGADKGDAYKDHNVAPFCCPVTGVPMNGNHTFAVNWKCGCVVSEKAITEVKSNICHGCGGAFDSEDVVVLNPDEEVLESYRAKLTAEEEARKRRKAQKLAEGGESTKAEKRNGAEEKATPSVEKPCTSKSTEPTKPVEEKKRPEKRKHAEEKSSIQNDKTASSVYKSLFTTCEAAKKKPEPHWITYNPLFY